MLEGKAMKINVASASLSNTSVVKFKAMIIDKTLILQSDEEGVGNGLYLEDTTGNFLEDLGIIDSATTHIHNGNETIASVADSIEHKVEGTSVIALGITDVNTALDMVGTFSVGDGNGNSFDVTTTDTTTLTELKDEINAQALLAAPGAAAVIASIEDNELVFTSTSGTYDKTMTFSDTAGNVLQDLNILSTTVEANETDPVNLLATINGIGVSSTSNSGVSSLIDGVNLTFLDETTVGTPITIRVKNETENIKTKINEFIEKYNEVMELSEALGAVKLDDTGELSATGILQGEFLISEIQNNARTILTQVNTSFLGTEYNSLDDIGVYTYGQENRLKLIDEDKLDDSLENHFDEMKELFRGVKYDDDGEATDKGVMRELDDYITNLIKPLTGRISLKTETVNTDISARESYVTKKRAEMMNYETYLWEHFAEMETAMASIQNGSDYMLQSLGM